VSQPNEYSCGPTALQICWYGHQTVINTHMMT
jgi:hypothetical protein